MVVLLPAKCQHTVEYVPVEEVPVPEVVAEVPIQGPAAVASVAEVNDPNLEDISLDS